MNNAYAPLLAVAGIASIAVLAWKRPARASVPPASPARADATREAIVARIAHEARLQGVDPRIALAFADQESGLNPFAEGDLTWHAKDQGERYRVHVLESPTFATNPYRGEPSLWHSYGLFQLLAPFNLAPHEHPRVLLDPATNIQRGVCRVRGVLEQSRGNLYEARRRYVGCGPGSRCASNEAVLSRIDSAWTNTLRKWALL